MIRLLLITDLGVLPVGPTVDRVRALATHPRASEVAIGIRDHDRSVREKRGLLDALKAVRSGGGPRLLVHDRVDLALAYGVDGVQLGERSMTVADARALLPRGAWIGRSCHDEAGLVAAAEAGVDAVTLSPVFASEGKGEPLGVARFSRLVSHASTTPVFALGGIGDTEVIEMATAGAAGVAMIRAWLQAVDVVRSVDAWLRAFDARRPDDRR